MTPDQLKTEINRWVDAHIDELVQFAETLVRYPSENRAPDGDEGECQQYLAGQFKAMGLEVDLFEPDQVEGILGHEAYWPGRNYNGRPNVVGVWKGTGGGRSLLFSSHADVVPGIDGRFRPYEPVRENGRLYGRGSSDMKGGLASTVFSVRCLQDLGIRLKGDVILESVVDEENGGANGTLAARLRGYQADAAICPEPTGMVLAPAHRGGCYFEITLEGRSGMPFGAEELVNPAYALSHLGVAIEEWQSKRDETLSPPPLYQENPRLPVVVSRLEARSLAVGVPREGSLRVWVEVHPGTSFEELESSFFGFLRERASQVPVLGQCRMEVRQLTRFLPGSSVPVDHALVSLLLQNFAEAEVSVPVRGAPFACDVFMFNLHSSTPCVLLGPRGGNAHDQDEWVSIEDLVELTKTFALTAVRWSGV